ncbi:MAG: ABC transporter ATP-binding protein [Oscillospiraceae bacterium]|jgi:iron complex transport system ATP-binding protein|nr:ABC transporter ATP-binding protein [Oscillospiraceae bacterium]
MMRPLLEVRNTSAGYRAVKVVRDVSFCLSPGERVSIIGPNGCGKTTLLKAICKLIPLMGGDVLVNGGTIAKLDRRALAAEMAMMAQISDQWFDFTVMDAVLMGRYSRRRNALVTTTDEDRQVAEQCLQTVGMTMQANDSITWLSGGQRQRVMLARAFAQGARIIVLDEPTNHLDMRYQAELFEHLKAWVSQSDRAVIQVMHDLNFTRLYSDRVLLMNDGRIIADGTPDKIMNMRELDETYNFGIRYFMKNSLKYWEVNTIERSK